MTYRMTAVLAELGFYLRVVDDRYRNEAHGDGPTLGILLTGTRDDIVIKYALGAAAGPMAAVTYQALPETLRTQLPSPETLSHAINPTPEDRTTWNYDDQHQTTSSRPVTPAPSVETQE